MKAGVPRHQTLTVAVAWTTGVQVYRESRSGAKRARAEWAPAPVAQGVAVLLASEIVSYQLRVRDLSTSSLSDQ